MKLTDLSIYFCIFFICILTVLHVKSSGIHGEAMGNIMYNNVMDGIVEDALRAGYKSIDSNGTPVVDLDEATKCFLAEKDLYGSSDRHILVYVDKDGFYVWDSDISPEWSDKQFFSAGESTVHQRKVYELIAYVDKNYGVMLMLPSNDGESIMNTVDEFSLIGMSFNRNYEVNSFSGAKIHEVSKEIDD